MPTLSTHCHQTGTPALTAANTTSGFPHGYTYNTRGLVTGRRICCASRYGRTGCGRTRQLYLADVIPRRHYPLPVVIAFVKALLGGTSVEHAYLNAIGCATKAPRQGWRWLASLFKQLPQWRP